MKCFVSVLFFSFFIVSFLSGQIVIDWTEIPQDLGTQFSHNGVYDITVDLISSGGPHAWQFTSQPVGPIDADAIVVPKASTPFGDSFPNSNLVYMITEGADTIYEYLQLTPTFANNLGQVVFSPLHIYYFRFDTVDTNPLPVVYGASRNYHEGYTIDLGSNMELRVDNYGSESIDAWGTVTITYGTFDCLRTCRFDTIASTMLFNGIPISGDTTNHIIYDFLVENYGVAVHVLSNEDETNPNYTDASFLARLTDFSTGIFESEDSFVNNVLLHPNPFSDYVTVSYSLEKTSSVTLEIFDISGRRVETMVDNTQIAGTHTVKWQGKNSLGVPVPDGIYFYSLTIDNISSTGKIHLIR